jgi:DNA-binding SARP family transcriptional activator/tetratricopeptide (TPR) repeat protein
MLVRVLGAVQIDAGDSEVEVGPPQRCVVLAALAADAGRLVTHETLVERVWGSAPPLRALRTVQTHVANLRGLLNRADTSVRATVSVRRRGGYLFDVDPDLVDVHRLRRLAVEAADPGRVGVDRLARWREAVGLWRGEPLAGLVGEWIERTRKAWYDEYRDVVLRWALAEIEAGHPTEVLGRLDALIVRYPLVESLPGMMMRALYAAGHRTEALNCFAAVRQRLDEELAERPGPQLQALYQAILRRDPTLPQHAAPAGATVRAQTAVPRQLPVDVRGYAGRTDQLARLDALAAALGKGVGGDAATPVVISAIAGTAGVGKTALAVHWAHRAAKRFPDGQLYVNLRGFDPDGSTVDPAAAIRGLLAALGVPIERLPADLDAQSGLYRTVLADRRMLIVLDNARDTAQVRPLLPGAPGCLVLVTSRNQLTGLIAATGAHCLRLDLLTPDEARDLLTQRLGARRVAAEPDAVDTLIGRCAGLPLALALVAARAATHPQLPLAAFAAELHDPGTRLDALAADDPTTDLRAVFSWSYTSLTPPAQRLFRSLGLHPGPDISAAAAASLAALTASQARSLLAEMTTASLIVEHRPGRYTFHDLLRAYAADLARHTDPAEERDAATERLLDHYLHTAYTAGRLLMTTQDPIAIPAPQPGTAPEHLATVQDALDWFTTEHAVLIATVSHAARTGSNRHTWHLAWSLGPYLNLRGYWHERVDIGLAALTAAERLGDPTNLVKAHRALATAYIALGRDAEARRQLGHSLDHAERADDIIGQAHAHHTLALLEERRSRHAQALHHTQQALDLFTGAGHQAGIAQAANTVGWLHAQLGNHEKALTYCQQALQLLQKHGHRAAEATTWDSLGYIHHHLGQHAEAIACYEHALALYQDVGGEYYQAETLTHLADTHYATGNHTAAREAWQQALVICDNLQHPQADKIRTKIEQLDRVPAGKYVRAAHGPSPTPKD